MFYLFNFCPRSKRLVMNLCNTSLFIVIILFFTVEILTMLPNGEETKQKQKQKQHKAKQKIQKQETKTHTQKQTMNESKIESKCFGYGK